MDGVLFDKEKTVLIYYPAGKTNSSYIVPNSVTTIGYSAFRSCFALASVTIPNSVITIGSDAFYWCTALASITIPNSVTVIGYSAFGFTALNSVTIPNSVTTIEGFAFAYCSALTSVTLGNGIVTIGGGAFYSCTALNSVINLNTEPIEISPYEFEGVNISACILKVPQNSVSAYQAAPVWQEFNIVGIQVYTVTLPTVTGATIAPSGGSSSPVEHGGSYSFTVTLATSHNQSTIVVKANGITLMPVGGVYTINNITANQTVTVEGVQINTYTITVTAGTGGTITPGTVIVSHGNSQTFEITPDEDYEIKDVFINGTSVGVVESYTFTDVQAEATIVANFEEKVGIGKFEPTNLKIYPNPTTGQLKIESEELKVENVEVFDVFGRTLLSQKFYMSPKTTINISHLTAGIYFLKVSTEAGQVIKKVLKK
jgi:hypothetical protein